MRSSCPGTSCPGPPAPRPGRRRRRPALEGTVGHDTGRRRRVAPDTRTPTSPTRRVLRPVQLKTTRRTRSTLASTSVRRKSPENPAPAPRKRTPRGREQRARHSPGPACRGGRPGPTSRYCAGLEHPSPLVLPRVFQVGATIGEGALENYWPARPKGASWALSEQPVPMGREAEGAGKSEGRSNGCGPQRLGTPSGHRERAPRWLHADVQRT